MDINEIRRLNARALARLSGSNAAFGRAIGKSPAQVNNWIGKNPIKNIGSDSARHIEQAYDKYHGWLDTLQSQTDSNVVSGPEIKGMVPVISWVQAGEWSEADCLEPLEADETIYCPVSHSMHTYALRVQGDSMTSPYGRSYPEGMIIIVDPERRGGVISGDRIVAKLVGHIEVTFKCYVEDAGQKMLKPLNPNYPMIKDEFRVLGKVIGAWLPE